MTLFATIQRVLLDHVVIPVFFGSALLWVWKTDHAVRYRQQIYDTAVEWMARMLSDVLQHPHVKNASAQTIVAGMNAFLSQPDLDQIVLQVNKAASKTQDEIARQAGQDFPKIVKHFVSGMLHQQQQQSKQQPEPSSLRDNISANNNDTNSSNRKEHMSSTRDQWQQQQQQQHRNRLFSEPILKTEDTRSRKEEDMTATVSETSAPTSPCSSVGRQQRRSFGDGSSSSRNRNSSQKPFELWDMDLGNINQSTRARSGRIDHPRNSMGNDHTRDTNTNDTSAKNKNNNSDHNKNNNAARASSKSNTTTTNNNSYLSGFTSTLRNLGVGNSNSNSNKMKHNGTKDSQNDDSSKQNVAVTDMNDSIGSMIVGNDASLTSLPASLSQDEDEVVRLLVDQEDVVRLLVDG